MRLIKIVLCLLLLTQAAWAQTRVSGTRETKAETPDDSKTDRGAKPPKSAKPADKPAKLEKPHMPRTDAYGIEQGKLRLKKVYRPNSFDPSQNDSARRTASFQNATLESEARVISCQSACSRSRNACSMNGSEDECGHGWVLCRARCK